MPQVITIVDYGMGNLRSVEKKVAQCGAKAIISADADQISAADKLILPGVGHFANGMKKLKERGMISALEKAVLINRVPILGICLGMQLMARKSEEGGVEGLGWFDAEVVRFRISNKIRYKVPHMGWNSAAWQKDDPVNMGISDDALFYFVHSYYVECKEPSVILAMSTYEEAFVSAVSNDNIYGMQFHPEKSHDQGEKLLKNFLYL